MMHPSPYLTLSSRHSTDIIQLRTTLVLAGPLPSRLRNTLGRTQSGLALRTGLRGLDISMDILLRTAMGHNHLRYGSHGDVDARCYARREGGDCYAE
jgi:hypothetical protein